VVTTENEIELKLDLDRDDMAALVRDLALSDTPAVEREQRATYFDTPGQDLREAGLSLRVRHANGRHVQTVKAEGSGSAGLFVRPERERDVAGDLPELDHDDPLRTLVPDAVLAAIRPAFVVEVTRRQWQIAFGGSSVELVADQGAVAAGHRTSPVSEVELELKSGDPAALFAFARELGASLSLRLGVLTKADRGYRLLAGAEDKVAKAAPLVLSPGTTTAQSLAAIVGSCVRQFRLNEDLLRRDARPEALHQARVALRRLRSAMSIYRPVVADGAFARLRDDCRWVAATLGQARDLDVLIAGSDTATTARLGGHRDSAYASAMEALASERSRWLMIDLTEWAAIGAWRLQPADPAAIAAPVEGFAATTLDRLYRRVKRRGRDLAALGDEERHRVRIDAKKLRYATGFFSGLFAGKKAARRHGRFADALEKLQEHLGELNDLATAPQVLARYGVTTAAGSPGERALLLDKAARAHAALIAAEPFWR
jgi:triphosphatase